MGQVGSESVTFGLVRRWLTECRHPRSNQGDMSGHRGATLVQGRWSDAVFAIGLELGVNRLPHARRGGNSRPSRPVNNDHQPGG